MAQANQSETMLAVGAAACSFSGEMASYYAEQEFDRIAESDWEEFTEPIFEKMNDLAIHRGLNWEKA